MSGPVVSLRGEPPVLILEKGISGLGWKSVG
jgi:hypothetical protein